MPMPTAEQVMAPNSPLADAFRKSLLKLAVLALVWTLYAAVHGYIPAAVLWGLWQTLRWAGALVLAMRLLGALSTATLCKWRWTDAPRLHGRVAVVTGASAGVGRETALQLAHLGATVILGIRDEARGKETEAALRKQVQAAWRASPGTAAPGTLQYLPLDLAELASVRGFAAAVRDKHPRVDFLINNAGLNSWSGATRLTKDGFDEVFGKFAQRPVFLSIRRGH